MIRVDTNDADEAVSAVSAVYCAHSLAFSSAARTVSTRLRAVESETAGFISLEYGAAVAVDAELDGITLVMHAARGSGTVRQRRETELWRSGQTIVVSGNCGTEYAFDRAFAQSTLRLDPSRITARCAELAGTALDSDVRFLLRPLPRDLESVWSQIMLLASRQDRLPDSGIDYLGRMALDFLLQRFEHSHSHLLSLEAPAAGGVLARALDAVEAMEDYELLTAADLAARVGVSLRTLQRAFNQGIGESPTRSLRNARLDRVRGRLERSRPDTLIADVAAAYGFFHAGRFAKDYRQRFGESPSETLRRSGGEVSFSG